VWLASFLNRTVLLAHITKLEELYRINGQVLCSVHVRQEDPSTRENKVKSMSMVYEQATSSITAYFHVDHEPLHYGFSFWLLLQL